MRAGAWARRRAEDVAALLLGLMFVAFVLQIAFRYVFNFPIGWSSELSVMCWLWLVLWGTAFVLREHEEIRFDLVYLGTGRRGRRVCAALFSVALVILYCASLKGSFDYVSFMKVEKSSYLKIPMSGVYSIYVIFLVAIIVRYLWLLWRLVRGDDPAEGEPSEPAPRA